MAKTCIYIDGYNLYYSRLKGTPYKWLDIVALSRDQIVLPQDPRSKVVAIKFLVLRRFHCDFSLHSVLIFNLPQ